MIAVMTHHAFNESVAFCWSIQVESYLSETAHYLQPSTCEEFQTAMRNDEYF
jgi:hypothetical protein